MLTNTFLTKLADIFGWSESDTKKIERYLYDGVQSAIISACMRHFPKESRNDVTRTLSDKNLSEDRMIESLQELGHGPIDWTLVSKECSESATDAITGMFDALLSNATNEQIDQVTNLLLSHHD